MQYTDLRGDHFANVFLKILHKIFPKTFLELKKVVIFAPAFRKYLMRLNTGEMAEWSNAAVLKTVEGHTSGGSNPSFSASKTLRLMVGAFLLCRKLKTWLENF